MTTQEQRRRNLRLGLVLAAVVVGLYAGFVVFRHSLLGG
ncbi:cytochrome oxidase small assembly protein [Alicycliphilus sp. T452]